MKPFALSFALLCSLFPAHFLLADTTKPDALPVNPGATPAARALLHEIDTISGAGTLSGEHNFPNTVSRYSDRVYELTSHYPAVFGQDFGFSSGEDKDSTLGRPSMIAEVIRQYRSGAVIALTWHSVRPTDDEPVTFRDSVQGHLTNWEFQQVLTPGSDLYNRWARQVDLIAGYLKELQSAGVPVLFRPYHEMNGNWFWWGGRPGPSGTVALYRQIYDRYVHLHHLDNLLWVWNVNAPSGNAGDIDQYFPGPGYADIITMDIYGAFEQRYYDSMLALAGPHKPIALAEVGTMPTLETLAAQPRWAYFMMWSGSAEGSNSPAQLQAIFHARNVVNRNDPRLPSPLPAPNTPPAPADLQSTTEARTLLSALSPTRAEAPLHGPEKHPAIAEFTLTTVNTGAMTGANAEQLLASIRTAATAGQVPLLRWTPVSPTGAPTTAPLTDFEWSQLMKPGSALHTTWLAELDAIAPLLDQLAQQHIAVLFSPLPAANLRSTWWGGRPGKDGSAALVQDVYERFATEHHLHSLLWLWEPAAPSAPRTEGRPANLEDFYPGPLITDALMLDSADPSASRGYGTRMIKSMAGTKPLGLRSQAPISDALNAEGDFAWTYTAPSAAVSVPEAPPGK